MMNESNGISNESNNISIAAQAVDGEQPKQTCPNGTILGSPNGGNQYLIEKLLGRGGFGEVYLASQMGSGMKVAIKILLDECYKDKKIVDRFVNEMNALKTVQHTNIVKMHERLEIDGHLYIVMEFVKGKTLEEYIANGIIFSEKQIVEFALILADALETVHKANIVHRDVKASNLMISQNGILLTPTLLDFGIVHVDNSAYKTQTGIAFGTPQYMSPEQCYGQEVDKRTDIYSFGVVLYLMECNRLPYDDLALWRVMQAQCQQPLPDFSRIDGSPVYPEIERIARRCLAKERDSRYQSFREIIEDLSKLLQLVNTENQASISENQPSVSDNMSPVDNKETTDYKIKKLLSVVSFVLVLITFIFACTLLVKKSKAVPQPKITTCLSATAESQTQTQIDAVFENIIAPSLRNQIIINCMPEIDDVAQFDIQLTGSTMKLDIETQFYGSHKADSCMKTQVLSFDYNCYLRFTGVYRRRMMFKM